RGQTLFNEGDEGDRLYVILSGKVKLTRTAMDGRENLLGVLGPSEMFGELSLFDPRPRTASAVAVTDAVLAGLGHDDLRPFLSSRPHVSLQLLKALAARLRRTNDVMADLVFTDVPGRVAKALLELAEKFGKEGEDGLHVHHDLTQEELAQFVGASRETGSKARAESALRGWLRKLGEGLVDRLPRGTDQLGDGQQGPRRVRVAWLAAHRGQGGRAAGRRADAPARPLTQRW